VGHADAALHSSIDRIPEKDLVARVLADRHNRGTLFNIKDFDTRRILREIDLRRFRPDVRGDIDVLVLLRRPSRRPPRLFRNLRKPPQPLRQGHDINESYDERHKYGDAVSQRTTCSRRSRADAGRTIRIDIATVARDCLRFGRSGAGAMT
jgi:hypothetical protein